MRKASMLAAALILAACSRNPEPGLEATGAADAAASDTAMSDTTMMAGDSTNMGDMGMEADTALADSALVNQEGAVQPDQQTMESDTVMGDSTLTGQVDDSGTGDSSMMHGDSTMAAPEPPVEGAVQTDSAQGQSP
jgi:hypothetical protein